jgi:hypothetical protein
MRMRRCRWVDETWSLARAAWGDALASDSRAFIADVTLRPQQPEALMAKKGESS